MDILGTAAKIFGEDTGLESVIDNPMAPWLAIPRLHHLLPYESYDQNMKIFYNKGSTGFVLLADPLVGASLNDQGQMASFFAQERNLAEGTAMQFMLFASSKINTSLSSWEKYRLPGTFQDLAQKRKKFLEDKASGDTVHRARDFKNLISYTIPGHPSDRSTLDTLLEIRGDLQLTLKRMGVLTQVCDAQTLIRELSDILNIDESTQSAPLLYNPYESISKQILDIQNDFEIKRDYVLKDNQYAIKTYFPKIAPQYWSLGHMDHFLGQILEPQHHIPCPFILHYGFVVNEGQLSEKTKCISKRSALEKSLQGQLARWQPQIKEEYKEAVEVVEQLQRQQRIITASLSVTVMPKKDQISSIEQSLQQIWQSIGWSFSPATYDHLGAWLSSMPMTWTARGERNTLKPWEVSSKGSGKSLFEMGKAKKTITREAQNMIPILGEWKGQAAPGIPLIGRRGQLFMWSPFDGMLVPNQTFPSNVSNYNVCISGIPGSGKSFLCNEMITTVLGVGGKSVVLDKGESFKNLCFLLGGHHIDFTASLDISLNPFTHIPTGDSQEDMEELHEQMNALVAVLRTMCKPKEECSPLEESFLKNAAQEVFKKNGNKGSIEDVRQFLLSHEDTRAIDLGKMLWTFSKEGPYSNLFNRPATVNLSHNLVVIETQNLKDDLRAVVIQLMMVQVWQRMVRSDRKTPFLILIDEAWELIQGVSSGKFIESMVRTARKYRASLVLATQNLMDYFRPESPGATVAFQNSEWKCVLNQLPETTTAMEDHPFLKEFVSSPFREQLLRSLMPANGFSEVLLYGKSVHGVLGRLYVDPYSSLLYSTNPQDFSEVQSWVKKGRDVGEAVELVLKGRGTKC